tara:strand:- start:317 stop:574 length:258 start_codon:yes stop_codon:yes gene_type:complete
MAQPMYNNATYVSSGTGVTGNYKAIYNNTGAAGKVSVQIFGPTGDASADVNNPGSTDINIGAYSLLPLRIKGLHDTTAIDVILLN